MFMQVSMFGMYIISICVYMHSYGKYIGTCHFTVVMILLLPYRFSIVAQYNTYYVQMEGLIMVSV